MKPQRDPVDLHLGSRLRLLRTARRLSLEELGKRVGVTYQQIQKYETGANRISASTLYRLAKSFDMSPGYFFEGLDKDEVDGPDPVTDREVLQTSIALSRVADPEVRQRLRALIESLESSGT